ncbi:MAG: hypothetical protein D6689_02100 [Deltaproteobacteria bacterium]|nr:MAG: hypothetical protein D6689_02100 [Deltaproteobacteria bacterium]
MARRARLPRPNFVALALAVLVAGLIYGAIKFVPVYLKVSDVDVILDEARYEGAEVDPFATDRWLGTTSAQDLAEKVRRKIVALGGIPDDAVNVYFSDDLRTLYADFSVVVRHPFGKTTSLHFTRSVDLDRD